MRFTSIFYNLCIYFLYSLNELKTE
uniref:Uncharacterized protein n=1 Tax=Rhizophora mucronata TaxID=61149 RepID=A0A2P2Q567_RHIMU